MARTAQKARNPKSRRVTRDLPPTNAGSKRAKGGAQSPHTGGINVLMGDGSVRMGDGSVVPGDGSVKFFKPT